MLLFPVLKDLLKYDITLTQTWNTKTQKIHRESSNKIKAPQNTINDLFQKTFIIYPLILYQTKRYVLWTKVQILYLKYLKLIYGNKERQKLEKRKTQYALQKWTKRKCPNDTSMYSASKICDFSELEDQLISIN